MANGLAKPPVTKNIRVSYSSPQSLAAKRKSQLDFPLQNCNRGLGRRFRQYNDLFAVATRLVEARLELREKSTVLEELLESTTSGTKMVRKMTFRASNPLAEITTESLHKAFAWGLLTDLELTLACHSS